MEDRIPREAKVKGKENSAAKGYRDLERLCGYIPSPDTFLKMLCPKPVCPREGKKRRHPRAPIPLHDRVTHEPTEGPGASCTPGFRGDRG